VPSALVGLDFDPVKMKESVRRSRGFRLANLKMFEDAEATATDDGVRSKIIHFRKALSAVIERLDEKERRLDEMIRTGKIPYGSKFI
jgi:hypothetical protein